MELESSNIIFGMQWLPKLGEMQVNWQILTMTFTISCIKVTLKRDSSLNSASVSMKSMLKAHKEQGERALLELGNIKV